MATSDLRRAAKAARRRVESQGARNDHRVVASSPGLARTKGAVGNVCGTTREQRSVERDNSRLHGRNSVIRLGTERRITLAITGDVEPPPRLARARAASLGETRVSPSFIFEVKCFDHWGSVRVRLNLPSGAPFRSRFSARQGRVSSVRHITERGHNVCGRAGSQSA